jgi:leucyl aminopeptidase (aminopeptidase T)
MADWSSVGSWLKTNGGTGAALIGSLLVGNVPGAIAAGVSLVSSATGHPEPDAALAALQQSPESLLKLRELAVQNDASIREHIRAMEEIRLKDEQEAHRQQQETIRSGDNASDEYVRHTRPMMARQSWWATAAYVIGFEALKAAGVFNMGADLQLAMIVGAPAAAYLGFRTLDKFSPRGGMPIQKSGP